MERRRRVRDFLQYACFVFFVISGCAAQENRPRSLDTDREALERFKAAVDPTGKLLPWVTGTNPCTWTGVQCYENRVAWLRLSGFQFTGTLPANTLADLDKLRLLSLHHNRFSGGLPLDLARCTTLRELYLGYNLFSGPLPDFTGLWPGMSHFNVGFNNFSGEIPTSINALNSLAVLDLQSNAFSGKMPELSFVNLLRFSVANNNLDGPIPESLQRFSNSSFVGNGGLCGPPTTNVCPLAPPPVVAPSALVPMSAEASAPTPSALMSSKEKDKLKLSVGAIAGIAAGAFVAVVLILCCLLFCCCRRETEVESSHIGKQVTEYNDRNSAPGGDGAEGRTDHFKDSYAVSISSSPSNRSKRLQFLDQGKRQEFALEELLQASAEVLGKGSMGTSYKADISSDCVVIVKRLKDIAAERKGFETHVEKLGRLRHRHLLPLRAYYFSRDEKLLVTDFMPRGSLHSLLHGDRSDDRIPLDWVSREKIALGSARALAYLHKPCVKMAHGNIKSSNILLNRDYEPYLSDYGLICLLNPASVGASRFVGYRAVEVTDIRKITMQSDVYSFGVLMLELITGKAPTQAANQKDTIIDLPKWITSIYRDDWAAIAFDPELKKSDNYVEEEMTQMLQLAIACVDRIPERRPKMEEVVLLLEDITQLGHSNDSSVCPNSIGKSGSPPMSRDSRSCGPTPIYTRPSSGVFVVGD
ncbi:hypothetical protein M758_10G178000 [Ceratodon purpureus]|nr:hypothetical protein M758_10G178000 [Ceratodon purpureus]KAG0604526.1 hypothetical protein M758_10G178000 [Ceratodon purpureus]